MASHHHSIKSGKKGSAKEHARYITRVGKYSEREDLVYLSHGNLPGWSEGDPARLWDAADKFERANGAAYREHEIALPNELSLAQNCALAEVIVRELAGPKPFQCAVHASEGNLGGIPNTHMHLMLSDRTPDGINRSPRQTYARYNAKHPEQGGCRKDSGGKTSMELRDEVIATRKKIADLQNQALAKHGFAARVDHRSLRAQGQDRPPERHLGPARVRAMSEDDKAEFTGSRQSDYAGRA